MNRSDLKKAKTNFRIVIDKGSSIDDGRGYAPEKQEAIASFDEIMKQVSKVKSAELWFEGELVKRI